MFEGDSADTCAGKFPLVSTGGRAEGFACTDPGARTPIGASGNYFFLSFCILISCHAVCGCVRFLLYIGTDWTRCLYGSSYLAAHPRNSVVCQSPLYKFQIKRKMLSICDQHCLETLLPSFQTGFCRLARTHGDKWVTHYTRKKTICIFLVDPCLCSVFPPEANTQKRGEILVQLCLSGPSTSSLTTTQQHPWQPHPPAVMVLSALLRFPSCLQAGEKGWAIHI